MKLKWKVDAKPTGRYRSFAKRSWPNAYYLNGDMAGAVQPVDGSSYEPRLKDILELYVFVTIYHPPEERKTKGYFTNVRMKTRAIGMDKAKALLAEYIRRNPQTHRVTRDQSS